MKKTVLLLFPLVLAGCTVSEPPYLQTQLQVREFQTRVFDTSNPDRVLSAIIDAFQDQGFMVKNVVPQVGLISATREVDVENKGQAFMRSFFFGPDAPWSKNAIVEATANVVTQGKKTKVRLTFQEKLLNNRGVTESVNMLDNPLFYQNFFEKISKSIFIEDSKL